MQNIIFKGNDNPIVVNFTFTGDFEANGLSEFTDIQINIGGEEYTLLSNPANVIISSNTQLKILIGGVTTLAVGSLNELKIEGVSGTYPEGYLLAGCCAGALSRVKVVEC